MHETLFWHRSTRTLGLSLCAMLLAALMLVAQPAAAQTTVSFPAVADARVNSRQPFKNFGGALDLIADGADHPRWTYLRFTVSGLTGTVTSAKLRLTVINGNGTTKGPNVHLTDSNWQESTITWNNRRSTTTGAIAVTGAIAPNGVVEYNVTDIVQNIDGVVPGVDEHGNGTFNFVLVGAGNNSVTFSSREFTAAPTLVVTQ